MKNLVLCCDGTANEFAADRTNVIKLCYTLVQAAGQQQVYYHPGLGTIEPAGALTPLSRRATRLLGQAIGAGLGDDVRDAYVFLMRHFDPGDRVFLFGFSRGAYTVRALASLLHMYGLISAGNEPLVPYAIRMLTAIQKLDARGDSEGKQHYFRLAEEFKDTFCRTVCKPWFVGVWDTVSSVGWIENQLRLPFVADNPDIAIGRHALALDERRAFFRTNLWRPRSESADSGPKDLKQVWFAGVHCDVGGGYREAESGASKIPLQWMIREAMDKHLLVDPARLALVLGGSGAGYVAPDVDGPLHESLSPSWWPAELIPKRHFNAQTKLWERRANMGRRRTMPKAPMVHESVFRRAGDYKSRLPPDAVSVS
ncbi:T6SS phospholipase effector Tle1-like catalytic domain-containing protein [Bradyrhizobium oligotrophicum]|uniref:T6SS phospholipase effector Tle1-like catalytic domain-containing protein n=1 Tax=Bradyrhizobium oligotrophicum TaxID=44255 RepID=UPI003EB83B32